MFMLTTLSLLLAFFLFYRHWALKKVYDRGFWTGLTTAKKEMEEQKKLSCDLVYWFFRSDILPARFLKFCHRKNIFVNRLRLGEIDFTSGVCVVVAFMRSLGRGLGHSEKRYTKEIAAQIWMTYSDDSLELFLGAIEQVDNDIAQKLRACCFNLKEREEALRCFVRSAKEESFMVPRKRIIIDIPPK